MNIQDFLFGLALIAATVILASGGFYILALGAGMLFLLCLVSIHVHYLIQPLARTVFIAGRAVPQDEENDEDTEEEE